MRIFLTRHGLTDLREEQQLPQTTLNTLGKKQAGQAALFYQALQDELAQIYVSPYARALETAQIIASCIDKDIFVDDRLREIPLWLTPADLFDDGSEKYDSAMNLLEETKVYIESFLAEVIAKHPNRSVLFVCHGNIIRSILYTALKMSLGTLVRLELHHASVSSLNLHEENGVQYFKLESFNQISHLKN